MHSTTTRLRYKVLDGVEWPTAITRLAVFSELQAAYSSERILHELYFHQHDDKKQLEERVRGVMADLEERIVKASIRTGSVIAKREAVANEVKDVTALVEEMLGIAKQSYGATLTASHMGHIALEHNVTISQLRSRIFDLARRRNCFMGLSMLTRCFSCHDSRWRECRVSTS